ncbi:histamine H2 receptor-like [Diadema setosum]|uniref:histamine H2 receptor-like n=1 Tax=Diadema setosum TaxID=31175 RepID=UPI003B3A754A
MWTQTANQTLELDDVTRLPSFRMTAMSFCFFAQFLSVSLNLLIIFALPRSHNKFGENGRLCFCWLAVSDLLGGLICFGARGVYEIDPSLLLDNLKVCALVSASCTSFFSMSNCLLAVASIDRYIAITRPMQYPILLTRMRILILLGSAAFCGITLSILRAFHGILSDTCDFEPMMYVNEPSMLCYVMLAMLIGFITAVMNTRLLVIARQHRRRIIQVCEKAVGGAQNMNALAQGGKMKSIVTVSLIVGAFYLVWTPYAIGALLAVARGIALPEPVYFSTIYIALSTHYVNALVFFGLHKTFRQAVCKMCRRETLHGEETSIL